MRWLFVGLEISLEEYINRGLVWSISLIQFATKHKKYTSNLDAGIWSSLEEEKETSSRVFLCGYWVDSKLMQGWVLKEVLVDKWLSMRSTLATPRATPIFVRKFDMAVHGILCQDNSRYILLDNMFLLIHGMPHGSLSFERKLSLKLKTQFLWAKTPRVVTWHLLLQL